MPRKTKPRTSPNEKIILNPVTACRALRKKAGLTQSTLAHKANVSLGVVQRLESARLYGQIDCRFESLIKISKALKVTAVKLCPRLAKK
jgi:predicted transcriptional regulator